MLLFTTAKLIMCEELHTLKHYLRKCLRTNTYYMCHVEDYEPNNKLATLARDWLMKREYDRSVVYNVWFAMRELIIKEFTVDPTYYDVMQTALHNRRDYAKTDPDEEYDWNYDNDNYADIKICLVYHLESIDDYINETCRIAGELREMYIDRDLHMDFSDIKSHYVNSVLFCEKSRDIYDKCFLKIDGRNEYIEAYDLLKKWCKDGSFHFDKDIKVTLTTITLVDIIGAVVDDVCKNHTNEYEYAYVVYMTWYATKMWMMLDSGKKYHAIDEIIDIIYNYDIDIARYIKSEYFDSPKDINDVVKCIQRCEKLLDKYINKFNRGITRADVSDLPFDLPYFDYSMISYNVKSYYRNIATYKNVLNKYIDIISKSNGVIRVSNEEFKTFCKGVRALKEVEEHPRVYKDVYENDSDRYECDYDSTDCGYAESDYYDSDSE